MDKDEFGRRIKVKYPQYSLMSNEDVADKVLAKHPQYNDLIKADTPETQRAFLQKTAGVLDAIFGGGVIGEAIGTQLAKRTPLTGLSPEERKFVGEGPSAGALAGDIAVTGLGILPFTGPGSRALGAGNLGARVIKGATFGASLGAAQAVKKEGEAEDIARGAAVGGVVGGAIPLAGAALQKVGEQIKALPDRFVRSAIGGNKKQILKEIAKGQDDTLSQFVVKNRKFGTAKKLMQESDEAIEVLNEQVRKKLITAGGGKSVFNTKDIYQKVLQGDLLRQSDLDDKGVRAILERQVPGSAKLIRKETLTAIEANKLRQALDGSIKSAGFLATERGAFGKEVTKAVTNELRRSVQQTSGTQSLFREMAKEIQLRDALANRIAQKATNQVISFGDLIGGGIGGAVGGGVPGAVAGIATRRAIESVPFKTGAAISIDTVSRSLEPVFRELSPAARGILLNTIKELVPEPEED